MGTINFGPTLEQAARAVAGLHERPDCVVVYATGAGAGIQTLLWEQPGASATLLDAQFPYARDALVDLLGEEPQQYCSQETAIRMAVAARARCRELAIRGGKKDAPTIGLGLTASVATGQPKRGDHRVYVAVASQFGIATIDGTFEKGHLTREEEGMICDLLALNAILDGAGDTWVTRPRLPSWGLTSEEVRHVGLEGMIVQPKPIPPLFEREPEFGTPITGGIFDLPLLWPDGTRGTVGSLNPNHHLIFPGSFDPLHFGHEQMVRHAERMTGRRVVFTINARHPDKGEIAPAELLRRAEQFRWRAPVLFTQNEPLFIDKARRFPGFGFLIGADVVLGLLNPKYYGGSAEACDIMIEEFRRLGTRFYVVGREVDGAFRTLDDIVIPAAARDLFVPVSGRWDIASRNLRQ